MTTPAFVAAQWTLAPRSEGYYGVESWGNPTAQLAEAGEKLAMAAAGVQSIVDA